jgi:GNAT superfamily N-acetyltransferase
VWVREDSRGKGIGKLMYEYTERYARDHGIKEVILDVMTSNPKSDFFHRAIGYKPFVQLYSKMID